jgi:hypothetical protein
VNPPIFGFSAGGHDATGTVLIDILVPDNLSLPSSFVISGPLLGASTFTATLFDTNGASPGTPAWTTGDLAAYLHLPPGPPPVTPANPIGAFLPTTQDFQPTADGFYVFQANIGSVTLPANPGDDASLLTLDQTLGLGSYVVAFITQDEGRTFGATAPSGAILEDAVPEPATWAMMLLGFGGIGVAMRRGRRKNALLAQIA